MSEKASEKEMGKDHALFKAGFFLLIALTILALSWAVVNSCKRNRTTNTVQTVESTETTNGRVTIIANEKEPDTFTVRISPQLSDRAIVQTNILKSR